MTLITPYWESPSSPWSLSVEKILISPKIQSRTLLTSQKRQSEEEVFRQLFWGNQVILIWIYGKASWKAWCISLSSPLMSISCLRLYTPCSLGVIHLPILHSLSLNLNFLFMGRLHNRLQFFLSWNKPCRGHALSKKNIFCIPHHFS